MFLSFSPLDDLTWHLRDFNPLHIKFYLAKLVISLQIPEAFWRGGNIIQSCVTSVCAWG